MSGPGKGIAAAIRKAAERVRGEGRAMTLDWRGRPQSLNVIDRRNQSDPGLAEAIETVLSRHSAETTVDNEKHPSAPGGRGNPYRLPKVWAYGNQTEPPARDATAVRLPRFAPRDSFLRRLRAARDR